MSWTDATHDLRLLSRALGPGRIRGIAAEIDAAARSRPDRAEGALRRGLRNARALHSRERRLVADGLRDLIRHQGVLDATLRPPDHPFLARWLAWMVILGADADEAQRQWQAASSGTDLPLARLADRGTLLDSLAEGLDSDEIVQLIGSVPAAMSQSLLRTYGKDGALAFVEASNDRAAVFLRANTRKLTLKQIQDKLAKDGVPTERSEYATVGLRLTGRANLDTIPTYKRGFVEVQDEGSQVLAELVDADAGPIVDFCAGAGGKSLALANYCSPGASILSLDVRKGALEELQRRAKKAGARGIRTAVMSAEGRLPNAAQTLIAGASRVLVDAPCSGSGVWRRHPEYRWRSDPTDTLPAQQLAILERAAPLVAAGGRLIYGTCSVLQIENEDVVEAFLEAHRAFEAMPVADVLGQSRATQLRAGRFLRLAPHTHGTDGFFGAVLRRRE